MSNHDGLLGKTNELRKELVAKDRPVKLLIDQTTYCTVFCRNADFSGFQAANNCPNSAVFALIGKLCRLSDQLWINGKITA
jgi:hypothetical protein